MLEMMDARLKCQTEVQNLGVTLFQRNAFDHEETDSHNLWTTLACSKDRALAKIL